METKAISCSEAGKRGGSARSAKKAVASRQNAIKAREKRIQNRISRLKTLLVGQKAT